MRGPSARVALLALGCLLALPARAGCEAWPAWTAFARGFISADGRVVDASTPRQHTVSEGQVYAMFFALVDDDRARFDQLLRWTENNLAQGDLTAHLPAWHWGRRDDGSWGVLDTNPAADADLFLAYLLAEAARLWNHRHYRILSALVGARVLRAEVVEVPGLGMSLLPAPVGFVDGPRYRLNPSYVPLMLLRGLAQAHPQQGWEALIPASRRLIVDSAPQGFSPDWALWTQDAGFAPDPLTRGIGSYDAIRVYLWAGVLAPDDPDRPALLRALRPMAEYTQQHGAPPEKVHVSAARFENAGPGGFSAALLPMLDALGLHAARDAQRARLDALRQHDATRYYDQVLRLFGEGAIEGRYRFAADGRLQPRWETACARAR